jgi:Rhodopirellula transposase DDE domain
MGPRWNQRCASSHWCVTEDDSTRHDRTRRRRAGAVRPPSPGARRWAQESRSHQSGTGGRVGEFDRTGNAGRSRIPVAVDHEIDASPRRAELTERGHSVSHSVVAKILHSLRYSLQGTRKRLEGSQHPDRDDQFRYINTLAKEFLGGGDPVISVDTKKKELVGRYAQAGKEWHPQGEPVEVSTYDFPGEADGKAIPYGVYDLTDNSAWVSVGIDHDTSVFAVSTIAQWWKHMGKEKYPHAVESLSRRLMV